MMNETSVSESLKKHALHNITNYYPDLNPGEVYLSGIDKIKKGRRSFVYEFEVVPISQGIKKRVILAKVPKKVGTQNISEAISCSESIEKAKDEYKTLCRIFSFIGVSKYKNLGAIRPLDYIPEFNAIITEKIQGINLLKEITRSSIKIGIKKTHEQQLKYYIQSSAELLRLLHSMGPESAKKLSYYFDEYLSSIDNVMKKLKDRGVNQDFLSFVKNSLKKTIHSGSINYNQNQITQLHGDYQIKNILISNGRVYCLDMGLQKVGLIYEDIARFLISLRMTRPLVAFHGILFNDRLIQMLQNEFLLSYFQNKSYSIPLLQLFLLKAIFQKWNRASWVNTTSKLSLFIKRLILKLVINPVFQEEIQNTLRSFE